MADRAALTWRVSSSTASKPALYSPSYSHCDSGPASRPTRTIVTPRPRRKATSASRFARDLRLPDDLPGCIQYAGLAQFQRHVIPTWCSMTVLLMVGPRPLGSALHHHSGRDPQGTSAPLQVFRYGIYRTPGESCYGLCSGARAPVAAVAGESGLLTLTSGSVSVRPIETANDRAIKTSPHE